MISPVTFVWMPTMTGKPSPQIWYGHMKTIKEAVKPIFSKVLTDYEARLTLTELMELYPAPEQNPLPPVS